MQQQRCAELCPLWVISGPLSVDHGCPLTPKIGHRKRRNTEIWYHCREERLDFCEKAIVQSLGLIVVVIAVLIANMPAVMQQWRTDKAGAVQTLWLAGAYVLYVGLGIWFVLGFMAPVGAQGGNALLAVGLLVSWIFYGGLTLMRVVPRYRQPPQWLMHFGVLDIVLLGLMFGCAGAYLWT